MVFFRSTMVLFSSAQIAFPPYCSSPLSSVSSSRPLQQHLADNLPDSPLSWLSNVSCRLSLRAATGLIFTNTHWPHTTVLQTFPSQSTDAVLLLGAPAGRPSLTLSLLFPDRSSVKKLHCHLISITLFSMPLSFFKFKCRFHKRCLCFKRELGCIKERIQCAKNYEMAFHFPANITQLLSVMIWVQMEQTCLQRHQVWRCESVCSEDNLLVLNMHAIIQAN